MRAHGSTIGTRADGIRRLEVITRGGRRRRWSDEDKARLVAESLDLMTDCGACPARPLCTRAEHRARHLKLPPRVEHGNRRLSATLRAS
jgi:hypothetical protein